MPYRKGDAVLRRMERIAEKQFFPILGKAKGSFVEKLVRRNKPVSVLEIGALAGYSGLRILRSMPASGRFTTLEIEAERAEVASSLFRKFGFGKKARVIVGDARKTLAELNGKFDFVLIDAEKDQYIAYLRLIESRKLLVRNAVIVADNVKIFANEVKDYLDYVRNSRKYESRYYDFGWDGMEVSRLLD